MGTIEDMGQDGHWQGHNRLILVIDVRDAVTCIQFQSRRVERALPLEVLRVSYSRTTEPLSQTCTSIGTRVYLEQVAETFLLESLVFLLLVKLPIQVREVQLEDVAHHDHAARRSDADGIRLAVSGAPLRWPDISEV